MTLGLLLGSSRVRELACGLGAVLRALLSKKQFSDHDLTRATWV